VNYLSKEEYELETGKHIREAHWQSAAQRWEYHEKAVEILKSIVGSPTILEAGTMGVKLCKFSDTIDLDIPPYWPLYYIPTYNHNLSVLPWPIREKQYDVFVALRVFHRFSPGYLHEMFRISNHIILALTTSTVDGYKAIRKPTQEIVCNDTIVLYWELENMR